jgi:hypothetical protein
MAIFLDSRLKIKRARHHIDELQALLHPVLEQGLVSYSNMEFEPLSGTAREASSKIAVQITTNELPADTPAILGDVVHNWRASLDLMASEMSELNGKGRSGVYFPFASDEEALEKQIKDKKFSRCGEDAVKLIRTFKPWKGGNTDLRAIHDLDIMDKHKSLMPQPHVQYEIAGFDFVDTPEGTVIQMRPPKISESFLVFPESLGLGDIELFEMLERLMKLCESIIESFAALYPSTQTG